MSKTKVSIIVCYFGKFPNYMDLFIRSCSFNNDYSWLIFTDNRQTSEILIPNITFIYLEFSDFQKLIKKRINKDTFADIYPPFVSVPLKQINRENHPNQSFIWEEGKVYRIINDKKEFDEYS